MPDAPLRPDDDAELLLATYGPALRRLARVYAWNAADQDDLLQEIALALWRSRPGFRGEASERTWVYRVAHNVASTFRARQRRRTSEALVDDVRTDTARAHEHRMDLVALVRRLPPLDRQIVTLYLEGLTGAEIAAVTGLTANNIGVRLTRARQKLQAELGLPGSTS